MMYQVFIEFSIFLHDKKIKSVLCSLIEIAFTYTQKRAQLLATL